MWGFRGFKAFLAFSSAIAAATPAFNPATIGFERFWDFSATGASASTTPPAYGATGALTWAASPVERAGFGPSGQKMLDVTAASSQLATFSSLTIPTATACYFVFAGGIKATNGTNAARLLGQAASSNVYVGIRGDRTGFTVRGVGMAAAVEVRFPGNAVSVGSSDTLELQVFADGSAVAYLNGVAGSLIAASSITGGFVLDQIGRTNSGLTGWYGALGVKVGELVTEQRTGLLSVLGFWRSTIYHIKESTGNDTSTGWNEANAWATLPKGLAAPVRAGDTATVHRGASEEYNLAAELNISGAPAATLHFGLSGDGPEALVTMSTKPTWTVSSGAVWSFTGNGPYEEDGGYSYLYDTEAAHPEPLHSYNPQATEASFYTWMRAMALAVLANPDGQRMARDTVNPTNPAAGKYGYAAGVYYVRMSNDGNPNGRVRVSSRPASSSALFAARAARVSTVGFRIRGGRWWYGSASGIDLNIGGTFAEFCDVRYWDSDGIDGFGTGDKTLTDSFMGWVGIGISTGSQGDNSSCHNGKMIRRRCLAVMGDKSGYGDTNQCESDNSHVVAITRNRPIAIFDNDTTQGQQVYTNYAAVILDGGNRPYIHNDGGLLTLRFGTIHGIGSATGKEGVRNDTGSPNASGTTLLDCIITNGVATGLNNTAGTMSRTYTINNAATATSGSVSGTTANSTAAANLTAPDTLDFRPAPGSPAIGAGLTVSGITTDLAGATRASPPAIGALEPA